MDLAADRHGVSIFAPAKVNLYLHVTGRRADGFHELDSLVVFAGVGDRLHVTPAEDLTLEISGPLAAGLSAGPDNLVMRAAAALRERVDGALGARLTLEKNLPVSSGVGGGSADAAATIKALVRLWEVHPARHDLTGLALALGADVPVCLAGRAAYMSGIGEHLQTLDELPDLPAVLVNPGVGVATPSVFKARAGAFSPPGRFVRVPDGPIGAAEALARRRNDLTQAALSVAPEIGPVLSAIGETPGCLLARMSGSGATCFGLFGTESDAERAGDILRAGQPGWWVAPTVLRGSG